jgi:RHS repeat-associated protein
MTLPSLAPRPACLALIAGLFAFAPLADAVVLPPVLAPSTADSTVGIDVTITCETPGAVIRYTLNGDEPTPFAPPVASGSSIRIARNAVLKVRAWLGSEASPVVTEDYRITGAVSNGYQHGLALSVAGRVWSWGEQASGRLGNGSTAAADIITPGRVLLPPDYFELGALIAAGQDHSLVIDQSGQTWAFGENASGQLGNNSTTDSALPVRVLKSATAGDFLGAVIGADAGQNFSLALLGNGTPVTWGSQSSGRLGNGVNSSSSRKYADPVENGSDPTFPDLTGIRAVAAGNGHGLAREANASEVPAATGRVWVWGSNGSGQLGRGNTSPLTRAQPVLLNATTELTHALEISGGGSHTAIVRWEADNPDLDGTVWSCGNQSSGRLGNGLTGSGDVTYPVKAIKVGGAPLTGIRQVSAGPSHTLALDADGHVWAWGDNSYGQLGDGGTTDNGHARLVLGANGTGTLENIVMVTAGGESTNGRSMALAGDGTIWVWGRNNEGQLGNGQTAAATVLPVAHAQNHVAEGEPQIENLIAEALEDYEDSGIGVEFEASHSGPGGMSEINRVEVFVNGELVKTLLPNECNCETEAEFPAGTHHVYAVIYDNNDITAMSDSASVIIDLDPSGDADGDGLPNGFEEILGSFPSVADSDLDAMGDAWEWYYGLPLLDGDLSNSAMTGASDDLDLDGRTNLEEFLSGSIPISADEEPLANLAPPGLRWFGKAGTVYHIETASHPESNHWWSTGLYCLGANAEIVVDVPSDFPEIVGDRFRLRTLKVSDPNPDDWDRDGVPNDLEVLYGLDSLAPNPISVKIDGQDYLSGQSAINIPYRQGETTARILVDVHYLLQSFGTWSWSTDGGTTWTPISWAPIQLPNPRSLDLPTGTAMKLRFRLDDNTLWEADITWSLITPSEQKNAITHFTIANTGHAISTAKAPLGAQHLAGPGGTGSLKLKKSGATGCYTVDFKIKVDPGSGYDPTNYTLRIFSAFNLPHEMPKGSSTGGSQEAPPPFSPIPDGTETLPLSVLQYPFPVNGEVTHEINPTQYGEPPYIVQIIPTPTPEDDFDADDSPVYVEASTEGYSSCSSCSSCITPQVSLQDTPLTLSLGGSDGYDETEGDPDDPQDPQSPEPRFSSCEADGELTFNIPSLYDPSASAITNPGIAGLGILAPRGAYDVTMVSGKPTEIKGERKFLIEPWTGRTDPEAFKVTGYTVKGTTLTKYVTMTVEKKDVNGVATLEVTDFQGAGTALRIHHFSKESNGATRSAILRSHNGSREIRREFTPTGPTTWTERRIDKESPTTGGATVAVHDEQLKFRTFSTGVSRVEERTIDPGNRGLKTRNFFYESNQNSGGATPSKIGAGRLKKQESYDGFTVTATYSAGKQEITTPYAGNPQGTKTTAEAAHGSFAGVGTAIGQQSTGTGGNTIGILRSTSFSANGSSSSNSAPEGQEWAGSSVIVGQGGKATVRDYLPRTDATAPGRISRVRERSGRLTTVDYNFTNGTKTIDVESGEPDASGLEVVKGERVRTTSTNCLRMLSEETYGFDDLAEKASPVLLWGRYALPTDFDDLGRSRAVHYNGYPSDDRETFTYSCCGVETHTGRRGKIVTFTYDSLGRVKLTTVKRSLNGPATYFSTLRSGLTVTRTRNDVPMSETQSNLAGEAYYSTTADEDGDGEMEYTFYYHTYSAAGRKVWTWKPQNKVEISEYYPDKNLKVAHGHDSQNSHFSYAAGTAAAPYHEIVTRTALLKPYNGNIQGELEWQKSAFDSEGRLVAQWDGESGAAKAVRIYNASTGLLASSSDADGIQATYFYHADGSLHHAATEISEGRLRVTTREYGYEMDDLMGGVTRGSRFEENYLQTSVAEVGSLAPVTVTWSRGDGYASRSTSASAGSTLSHESVPTAADREAGAWTSTQVGADGSRTFIEFSDGLLEKSSTQTSAGVAVGWTAYTYDDIGRLFSQEDSRTGITTYDADDNGEVDMTDSGNVLAVKEPAESGILARITRYEYDELGRRVRVQLPDGSDTFTVYSQGAHHYGHPDGPNSNQQVRSTHGSQAYPVTEAFDTQGRLTWMSTQDPTTGPLTRWNYDSAGRLAVKTDAEGRTTEYRYTAAGRLEKRKWARSAEGSRILTEYDYDEGFLEQVTYGGGQTAPVTYGYDAYGRRKTVTQMGNTWSYEYDPTTWMLAREIVSYDLDDDDSPELERVIQHDIDPGAGARPEAVRLGIDTNGTPATLEALEHEVIYHYDSAGRLDGINATGLPAAPTSSSGHSFHYQYVTVGYNGPAAQLIESVSGPVHNVFNGWDPTRDALDYKETWVGNELSVKYDYELNPLGQRIGVVLSGNATFGSPVRTWNYNSKGELVGEGGGGSLYDRGYSYDEIGNRLVTAVGTTDTGSGWAPLASYKAAPGGGAGANALNQYGEVTLPGAAPVPVVHDLDGNMTSGPLPAASGEESTLKWDAENRLIEAQVGTTGPLVRYHYDPFGRRIAKTVGTSTTPQLYLYDGWNLVAKYTGDLTTDSAALDTAYTWGLDLSGSLQGAGGVGGLLAIHEQAGNGSSKAGEVIYPAYDGNGNIDRLFDSIGLPIALYAYDGFGNRLSLAFSDVDGSGYAEEQEFGFSTKFRDAETGLIYYGYRYYDPVTGRWPSRDPIGERGGLNLYAMLANSPSTRHDVLGKVPGKHRPKSKTRPKKDAFENRLKKVDSPEDCPMRVTILIGGLADESTKVARNTIPYDVYAPHYDQEKVEQFVNALRKCCCGTLITIIGHSWGADTALDVANNVDAGISQLVTVDGVSRDGKKNEEKPENVNIWTNVYQPNDVGTLDNTVANVGGHWGEAGNADENVAAGDEMTHGMAGNLFDLTDTAVSDTARTGQQHDRIDGNEGKKNEDISRDPVAPFEKCGNASGMGVGENAR